MAYKYKKYKIKWDKKKRKFTKRKIDRNRSRKARLRWRQNRGKMKNALRVARRKGKKTMRRNKNLGIYKKLKQARKKFKSILKNDVDMDIFTDALLNEDNFSIPVLELNKDVDLDDMISVLDDIETDVSDQKDYEEYLLQFISDAKELLDNLRDVDPDDITGEEMDQISDIIDLIDEYGKMNDLYDNNETWQEDEDSYDIDDDIDDDLDD